ncbi:putative PEP-binding protein, partial [Erwinia amylovora]|uniref:putative PEP-binding protein n=1 Tax=Erwinia amylovora TaxID=552 RepID=UPI0034A4402F
MVSSLEEIDEARNQLDRAARELEEMLGYAIPMPRLGILIAGPSRIFLIDQLRQRVE